MKSSQGPVKSTIGCWTRPGTTTVYTKEKMSKLPWSLILGPQKAYFKAYIFHQQGPTGFVAGEAKEVLW